MSERVPGRPLHRAAFRSRPCAAALAVVGAFVAGSPAVGAAEPDVLPGSKKAEYCAGCHGADGNSELTDYPILAGQTTRYSYLQLKDYKSGRRKDEMMNPVAAQLEKQDMVDLAAYYAAQRPKGPRIQSGENSV